MDEDKNERVEKEDGQNMTLGEAIRKMPDIEDYDLWETLGEMRIE